MTVKHTPARSVSAALSSALVARENCRKSGNTEWFEKHCDTIASLLARMPSGAGFDQGTAIDHDATRPGKRLVFRTSFHHMNEHGYYDGWTTHRVTVTPTFDGFDICVSGRNRNDIRDYIADCFHHCLTEEVP